MSEEASNIGVGAATGAASGAAAGTGITPGVGTIIGAAVGAIAGIGSGLIKNNQDKKNREREVKRVEEREDNAIRRATADSLLSGIDPRSSGQVPNAAGSSSVQPQETVDLSSELVSSATSAGQAFDQIMMQRQLRELDLKKTAFSTLLNGYDQFITQGTQSLNDTNTRLNDVVNGMKGIESAESSTSSEHLNEVRSDITNISNYLQDKEVRDLLDAQSIKLDDHLIQKYGKTLEDIFNEWRISGKLDVDFIKFVSETLKSILPAGKVREAIDAIQKIFFSYSPSTKMQMLGNIPGMGIGPTDMYTSEGAPIQNPATSTNPTPYRESTTNGTFEKESSSSNQPIVPPSDSPKDEDNRHYDRNKQSKTGVGFGVGAEYHVGSNKHNTGGQDDAHRVVTGDEKKNYTRHTGGVTITHFLWSATTSAGWHESQKAGWSSGTSWSRPNQDSYQRYYEQFCYYTWLRSFYSGRINMPIDQYILPRLNPVMDALRNLQF